MNKFMMKIGIDELFVVDAVKKTGGLVPFAWFPLLFLVFVHANLLLFFL